MFYEKQPRYDQQWLMKKQNAMQIRILKDKMQQEKKMQEMENEIAK